MNSVQLPDDIVFPDSPLCVASRAYAQRVSPPFLFNHVMRTYAFAATVGGQGPAYDAEILYIGCLLHDLGLCETVPTHERFEVDGADAAKEFLTRQGMPEHQIELVWDAIALHTTAVIPQRKQPEIALVQLGAALDVGVVPLEMLSPHALEQILDSWPRLGFKQALVDLLKQRLLADPRAAASHVVADVGCQHIPGFSAPNFCDVVAHSQFAE